MANAKKAKNGQINYFLIGMIAIAVVVAAYVLITWDWPSHDSKDIVGKWLYDTSEYNIETQEGYGRPASVIMEFTKDGAITLTSLSSGDASTGTYKIEGEKLTFSFDTGDEEFEFVIKGDKMILGPKGDQMTLTRTE